MKKSKKAVDRLGLLHYQHPDKFGQWLGYKIHRIDKKRFQAEASLKIREDHLSPAGRVHGGVVSAFFDYTLGAAVFSTLKPDDYCSTVEIKVNYLLPVELGDRLTAKTRVVFRGKRLCVIEGFVYKNAEKKPTAMATATFNVVSS